MEGTKSKAIFVTGGAGYVGSHTVLVLLEAGFHVVAVDNFVNATPGKHGKPESLHRVEELTGKTVTFYTADLLSIESLDLVFSKHTFICVIHFAALKAVGESCKKPLDYYKNNIGGTVNLLEVMKKHGVRRFIFSSSATVYGVPKYLPLDENHPVGFSCTNPYGRTKYFIEEILKDLTASEKGWQVVMLRYFNPVGAHESGRIGEDPQGTPNNLMPYIAQVAVGRKDELLVFGHDFNTPDGTGVRDYIHIADLAKGHVAALKKLLQEITHGYKVYNLGTGKGYSVLQVIKAFEEASGVKIPYRIVERRPGDVDEIYANPSVAEKELGWKAECDLLKMCSDTWHWQSLNPCGYQEIALL